MKKKYRILTAGGFVLFFLLLLLYFFIFENRYTERSLFFIDPVSREIMLEYRVVPEKNDMEKNIEILINEIFLGSSVLFRENIFPAGTKAVHVLFRKGKVYVDLNENAVFKNRGCSLSFEESADIFRKSVRFNFPAVDEIVLTVKGILPK